MVVVVSQEQEVLATYPCRKYYFTYKENIYETLPAWQHIGVSNFMEENSRIQDLPYDLGQGIVAG